MLRTRNTLVLAGRAFETEHSWPFGLTVALAGVAGVVLARGGLNFPHHIPAVLGLVTIGALAVGALVLPVQTTVLGFALLAFVRVEPAPVDLIFALLMFRTIVLDRSPIRVPPLALLATAGFAAWTVFSVSNTTDLGGSLRYVFITLYLLVLATWLTAIFRDGDLTRACVKTYIYAAVVSAAVGLVALRVGFPGSSTLLYGNARVQAFFKDPNVFGPFLVPAAMILIEDLGRPRLFGRRARPLVFAALLILVAGLVFAFSRAAWLNFGVATVVLLLVLLSRRGGARAVGRTMRALAFSGTAALLALWATGSTHFFESRTHLQAYDQSRFATQHTALDHTWVHLFGYGPGQAEIVLGHSTHSLFARVFFEQGFVGGSLLVVLLLATTAAAVVLALADRDVHAVGSAALLAAWIGLLVNSVFVDTLHWRHLWLVAALIWYGADTSAQRRNPARARPTAFR